MNSNLSPAVLFFWFIRRSVPGRYFFQRLLDSSTPRVQRLQQQRIDDIPCRFRIPRRRQHQTLGIVGRKGVPVQSQSAYNVALRLLSVAAGERDNRQGPVGFTEVAIDFQRALQCLLGRIEIVGENLTPCQCVVGPQMAGHELNRFFQRVFRRGQIFL